MTDHSAALDWLKSQEGAMIALLEELVNTDSGSYDKAGVDAAGEVLKAFFTAHGIAYTTIPHETFGEAIRAELPCPTANDTRSILLLGHRDTVFPKGEPLRRPFRISEGRGYGPGVMDMKGGLVMNAFVMAAFAKFGGHGGPLVMLVTSDEEIASPSSRPVIENEARQARAVFNSEPSKAPHAVVSGRKGGVFLSVMVRGKAAHSGAHYEKGISAIEALAKKIPAWHALTDFARGVTVNVGLISGGQTVNTVAPWAKAEIDLRYKTTPDRAAMIAAIEAIAHEVSLPGTSAEVTITGEFLPLEETPDSKALFALYRDAAAQIGFEVTAEFTGSCADSGLTASVGCPTICSVGPVGDHGHTPEEYVEIGSLVPCAQAMALAVAAVKL